MYQFATQSMKNIHPTIWMENHMNAHKFFVNEAGILVNSLSVPKDSDISEFQLSMFEDSRPMTEEETNEIFNESIESR